MCACVLCMLHGVYGCGRSEPWVCEWAQIWNENKITKIVHSRGRKIKAFRSGFMWWNKYFTVQLHAPTLIDAQCKCVVQCTAKQNEMVVCRLHTTKIFGDFCMFWSICHSPKDPTDWASMQHTVNNECDLFGGTKSISPFRKLTLTPFWLLKSVLKHCTAMLICFFFVEDERKGININSFIEIRRFDVIKRLALEQIAKLNRTSCHTLDRSKTIKLKWNSPTNRVNAQIGCGADRINRCRRLHKMHGLTVTDKSVKAIPTSFSFA